VNEQRAPLAVSIAALFLAACEQKASAPAPLPSAAAASGKSDLVQCLGIHECKGKSACHVAGGHACAGQNECKGKGWISVSRAECGARGGKVLEG
jgi:nitrous oxide reductase accessory protein NosL